MHLKRNEMPKSWPLAKKGTKYIVRPLNNLQKSIPLLIILRDILKIAQNKKEVKKLLHLKKIKVNCKTVNEERFPLMLFDTVSLDDKNFRLILKNRKFSLQEISDKEAGEKTVKVIGKKVLKGKKLQVNLNDGRNFLYNEKLATGDSVIIDLKENKISRVLPFKEGSRVIFISGKHIGEQGKIEKIEKNIMVKAGQIKINAEKENLMVVE